MIFHYFASLESAVDHEIKSFVHSALVLYRRAFAVIYENMVTVPSLSHRVRIASRERLCNNLILMP